MASRGTPENTFPKVGAGQTFPSQWRHCSHDGGTPSPLTYGRWGVSASAFGLRSEPDPGGLNLSLPPSQRPAG